MAPRKNVRKTLKKKKKKKTPVKSEQKQEMMMIANLASPVKLFSDDLKIKNKRVDDDDDDDDHDEITSNSIGCTTPKAKRYKIPEILTCPPAPKKRRPVSSCTLRRTQICFFDPPDLELFFASHLTSIYNHVHTHAVR